MPKYCYNYDSGDYEYIDENGYSWDQGNYVYNWDDSEYRREEEEEKIFGMKMMIKNDFYNTIRNHEYHQIRNT